MPGPTRPIKEDMAEVTEKTIEAFPEEHNLVRNIAGLYIEVLVLIEKIRVISKPSELAILCLASRNFRLLYCSRDSIYNGFYDVSMILLRVVYENDLLIQYLTDNDKEAERWLLGFGKKNEVFSPSFLRRETKDKSGVYGFLSRNYTHANVESLFSAGLTKLEGSTLSNDYFPTFQKDMAERTLASHIMFSWLTLIHLQYAFRDLLWKNEEWTNRFSDWNDVVLNYIERRFPRACS